MRVTWNKCFALLLILHWAGALCSAQDESDNLPDTYDADTAAADNEAKIESVRAELGALNDRIEREERHLNDLRRKQNAIEQELAELARAIKNSEDEKTVLANAARQLSEKLERLREVTESARNEREEQRAIFTKRLVAFYKSKRRTAHVDYLFQADSFAALFRRAHYLAAIADHDERLLGRLSDLFDRAKASTEELAQVAEAQKAALVQAEIVEGALRGLQGKKAALLQEQQAKAQSQAQSLRKLEDSAANLENALARLMGQDEIPGGEPAPEDTPGPLPTQAQPSGTMVAAIPKSGVEDRGFDGLGLARRRGKLEFPVSGTLVQPYGTQKHEEFSDVLMKKGIEISASPGTPVKVVAPGRVVFAQVLPGFGQVVIVDHGKRYYTLYGRLALSKVRTGETVQEGQIVAVLGEIDHRGRNFYFELRHEGKAIDPGVFFAAMPKKGAQG